MEDTHNQHRKQINITCHFQALKAALITGQDVICRLQRRSPNATQSKTFWALGHISQKVNICGWNSSTSNFAYKKKEKKKIILDFFPLHPTQGQRTKVWFLPSAILCPWILFQALFPPSNLQLFTQHLENYITSKLLQTHPNLIISFIHTSPTSPQPDPTKLPLLSLAGASLIVIHR